VKGFNNGRGKPARRGPLLPSLTASLSPTPPVPTLAWVDGFLYKRGLRNIEECDHGRSEAKDISIKARDAALR
jgi:hypothetical protein